MEAPGPGEGCERGAEPLHLLKGWGAPPRTPEGGRTDRPGPSELQLGPRCEATHLAPLARRWWDGTRPRVRHGRPDVSPLRGPGLANGRHLLLPPRMAFLAHVGGRRRPVIRVALGWLAVCSHTSHRRVCDFPSGAPEGGRVGNVASGLGDRNGAQSLSCPCRAGRCCAVSLRGHVVRLARPAGPRGQEEACRLSGGLHSKFGTAQHRVRDAGE